MTKVRVVRNGSKGNWQMYYRDPITKKRVWRSALTTRRSEAERAAARWEADIEAGKGLFALFVPGRIDDERDIELMFGQGLLEQARCPPEDDLAAP